MNDLWKQLLPILASTVIAITGGAIYVEARISTLEAQTQMLDRALEKHSSQPYHAGAGERIAAHDARIEALVTANETLRTHIGSRLDSLNDRLDKIEEMLRRIK